MTSTTARRLRRAATGLAVAAGTGALLLATTVSANATVGGPYVAYLDAAHNDQLAVNTPDGAGTATVLAPGLRAYRYDVSADGSTFIMSAATGTLASDVYDTTAGLTYVRAGTAHLLATYADANPVLSADGTQAWFSTDGDIFHYASGDAAPTRVTTNQPLSITDEYLTQIAVNPGGTSLAATFVGYDSSFKETASEVAVFPLGTATPSATWSSPAYSGAANPEVLYDNLAWQDDTHLVYGLCTDGTCAHWGNDAVDLSGPPATTVLTNTADHYGLRELGSTWYLWADDGTTHVTSLATTADLTTALPASAPRTDGTTTHEYVPTNAIPPALTGATVGRAVSHAHLVLSSALVPTGAQAVYSSYDLYLLAVGAESFGTDAAEVDRGLLQYSIDGGHSYKTLRTTTHATQVAWPHSPYPGNGRTQKLTSNTWFRWVFPGDAFVGPGTSPVSLVRVTPTVTLKVAKSGSHRIVSGKVARIRGSIVLYKGSKKIATVHLSSSGAYSFGKRTLAKGSYKVVVLADKYWAGSTKTFKI